MQNGYSTSIICSVRYRQFPSGQSHQLSTGAVKKPTSPVGFFTSGFCCIVLMLDVESLIPARATNSISEQ
ncbi:hypothetical protein DPD57_18905 [Salmonella enterica subsp. enterica serovar Kottbus]|nr:hypothetical protein [Salmonella enterica subsp. enterica serovar Litchfield]EBW3316879.1 hypothetical protein [Salmonella enterica subsp. enterica serovar Kottbus]EBX4551601.1 hypothetical protein [Salmonella enterica subsp. enterica serovar Saintpaul]EBX5012459.1 hypothetical protein [Salmonella enterica subsp. enterica serovar Umbilo]ECF6942430.1 hypothetical protein [Salmonella enterica subsp. enterica]